MSWRVVVRPEVEQDVNTAVEWYDSRSPGLGSDFVEEILEVFAGLASNPLLYCPRHPNNNIRWRYPERFPYRVIYEVIEAEELVVITAVLHAAQHDSRWRKRI